MSNCPPRHKLIWNRLNMTSARTPRTFDLPDYCEHGTNVLIYINDIIRTLTERLRDELEL